MIPYFRTEERTVKLQAEAAKWLDTPFFESMGPRGRQGVASDCCSAPALTLQAVGAIGAIPWPKRYVSRGGGEAMLRVFLEVLDGTERLVPIWRRAWGQGVEPLLPGDLLVSSTGRSLHHLALFLGGTRMLHCWDGKCRYGSVDDQRSRLLHSVYRALELPALEVSDG